MLGRIEEYFIPSIHERFWNKIEYSADCWKWIGCIGTPGYGVLIVRAPKTRKRILLHAHRISWFLHHHRDPKEMYVLHRCDNPSCVNPEHLFLGTHLDNIADMVKKGRASRGADRPTAKLSEQDVLTIRDQYSKGDITQKELGQQYNVEPTTIGQIVRRKTWTHI